MRLEKTSTQREVSESERSFKMLVEAVTDYALYMLDPTGHITSWNVGGQRIKGYHPSEIIGQHFSRFYTPADQAIGKPARALKIATEAGRYEEDGWRVRKDGTFFWASVVLDSIYEDGALIGFVKITRDITERREAQLRLEKMQRQLAESQKLDALGQLTGGVAHDFNNLLMIIGGSLNILRRYAGDDSKARKAVQAIEAASNRGAALTRQLLTFARRQSVSPQTVNLPEQIKGIKEVIDTGLGSAVSLTMDDKHDIWPVTIDVAEFETALVNVIINARDAMPDGGAIHIALENSRSEDPEHPGDYVAVHISDTGVGIPTDIAEKVFDPFFTTKPVGKGTGLGLSQVHGFAYQAGGSVKLRSELGKGTTVTLCLPRSTGTPSVVSENSNLQSNRIGTVLLVEDNPDVASVSTSLLEELGYSVCWAGNAEAALKEIEQGSIDLLFSDIVMPGKMDGLALARTVRQQKPHIPILLVTGYSSALRGTPGEFPVIRKPYQLHELSRAIESLSDR